MDTGAWIVLSLFACIGVVQIVGWLVCLRKRPRGVRRGYHLIPLYNDPDRLEAQLQHALAQVQWGSHSGELVLLVDMGLGEECQKICERLTRNMLGIFTCRQESLVETILQLDDLQESQTLV